MKKIVLILFVVILAFGFIIIYPVLFQEGNPLPILKGIAKLSFDEDEIVKISDNPQRYISKTDTGKSPIIDLMSQESWEFEDQMGSGYIFYKNGNRKNVSSVQYTKKYIIWELPNDTSSSGVSLDFLITPEKMIVHSNEQLMELEKAEEKAKARVKILNEKYDDLSKISVKDMKIQEEINNELTALLNSGKNVENKEIIENIFIQLRELEGVYIDIFEEDIIAKIYLSEGPETSSVASSDNNYIRMLILLEGDSILIAKGVMSDSTTGQIEYIKVKLSEKLKYELEEIVKEVR